jgi:hypothetical protein
MKNFNTLLTVAVVLIALWVLASVTRFLAGAILNLLLLAGIVLLIVWGVRKLR